MFHSYWRNCSPGCAESRDRRTAAGRRGPAGTGTATTANARREDGFAWHSHATVHRFGEQVDYNADSTREQPPEPDCRTTEEPCRTRGKSGNEARSDVGRVPVPARVRRGSDRTHEQGPNADG